MREIPTIGLIGCGRQGLRYLRNLFYLQDEGKIGYIYVFDQNPDAIKNAQQMRHKHRYVHPKWEFIEYHGGEETNNYIGSCDAIIIATPPRAHYQNLYDIINYPQLRGVLVEKPMGVGFLQCTAMKMLAELNHIHLMPAMTERFNQANQKLRERVAIDMQTNRRFGIATARIGSRKVEHRWDFGGVGLDVLVHDIDLAIWMVGKTPQVVYVGHFEQNPDVDIRTGMQCIYVWNPTTSLNATVGYRSHRFGSVYALEVWFDKHYYRVEPGHQVLLRVTRRGDKQHYERIKGITPIEPIYLQLFHFLEVLQGRQKPLVTAQDAINAVYWAYDKTEEAINKGLISLDNRKGFVQKTPDLMLDDDVEAIP
ncbi:MAG: Gfo/Idh/MocA family protein [Candidatus Thorarchaeota archaeon]|jgi:predicted dehydrogenase